MAEHEIDAVDPQFGIGRDASPTRWLRQRIVVAEDQVLLSIESGQDLGRKRGASSEIADVPHLIVGRYDSVPALNHCGIHVRDRFKGPRIKVQYPVITEVRVADEKDGHLLSARGGTGAPHKLRRFRPP